MQNIQKKNLDKNIELNFNDIKPDLEKQYDIARILEFSPAFNTDIKRITLIFDSRDYENKIETSIPESGTFILWSLMRCCELARKSHIDNLKIICTSNRFSSILPVWSIINFFVENIDLSIIT